MISHPIILFPQPLSAARLPGFNLRGATYLPTYLPGAGGHLNNHANRTDPHPHPHPHPHPQPQPQPQPHPGLDSTGHTAEHGVDTTGHTTSRIDYGGTTLARPTPFTSTRMQAKLSTLAAALDRDVAKLRRLPVCDSAQPADDTADDAAAAGSPGRSKRLSQRERYSGLVGFEVTGQVSIQVSAKRPHRHCSHTHGPSAPATKAKGGHHTRAGGGHCGRAGAGKGGGAAADGTLSEGAAPGGDSSFGAESTNEQSLQHSHSTATAQHSGGAASLGRQSVTQSGRKGPRDRNHCGELRPPGSAPPNPNASGIPTAAVGESVRHSVLRQAAVVDPKDLTAGLRLLTQHDAFLKGRPTTLKGHLTAPMARGHGKAAGGFGATPFSQKPPPARAAFRVYHKLRQWDF